MREPRNPFILRAAEQIESDVTFLRVFAPGVLDLLPEEGIWDRIQMFRSAPGGGKTTLFRLFTPQSLVALYDYRGANDYKDLYNRLKKSSVISEDGPKVLGIYLSLGRNYALLEDLPLDKSYKFRLFYALLNSKITIATLRNALTLEKLRYPEDLDRLHISRPADVDIPSTIPVPCSGVVLHEWATSLEKNVVDAIDSFASPTERILSGHETLYCLNILRPKWLFVGNKSLEAQPLIMLDDVHKLTQIQRENLLNTLSDLRVPVGIWLAERLEALTPRELLSGATSGREYSEPIILEDFWRGQGNSKRFENTMLNIADRRARLNPEVNISSFAFCLESSLDGSEWNDVYAEALFKISKRVKEKIGSSRKYDIWIDKCENVEATIREHALSWRVLEIIIERDLQKAQQRLFDLPLSEEEMDKKDDSTVSRAAELFMSREFKIPYYFGFSRLVNLASWNIEQFLEMAAELFEEIISAQLLREQYVLTPNRQEDILRRVAERRWEQIKLIPNAEDVLKLLEAVLQLCQSETFRPNAPYAPGATGFAITMNDRERLIDPATQKTHPEYERLAGALSTCIANNLLEAFLDRSQGQAGQTWMIMYLSRLLCLTFGLPLQYGGWRPKTIDELSSFLSEDFKPKQKRGGRSK